MLPRAWACILNGKLGTELGIHYVSHLWHETMGIKQEKMVASHAEEGLPVGRLDDGETGKCLSVIVEKVTLELMMVVWMPLSLILMVICLSDRSGLMNGGWILTWGFFLGSIMYLHKKRQQAWTNRFFTITVLSQFTMFSIVLAVSAAFTSEIFTVSHWMQPGWQACNSVTQPNQHTAYY